MPFKSVIFYGIFEDFRHWNHCRRGKHQATRVEGVPTPPGRAPCLVGPWWVPSPYASTHTLHLHPPNKKNQLKPESKLILLSFSISLLKAPLTKLLGEIVPWYICDSSIGPISFCSSALFIANFCCIGDPVLELACQIYEVPSNSNAWYRL